MGKIVKLWLSIIIIISLLSTLLVGCGKSTQDNNSVANTATSSQGATTEGSKEATQKKLENVSIRFSTWDGGETLTDINEMVKNFTAENPNIKVNVEYVADQYVTKMLTQIAGGDAPDVMQIGDVDVVRFAKKGYFEPLDTYAANDSSFNKADYFDTILATGTIDNKLYALPAGFSNEAVYYNKDLFDKAGVPYPQAGWTWQDFYETAKKLTVKKDGKIVQWGAETVGSWGRMLMPLINSFGGDFISPDGKSFDGYMNNDGTVKALEFYRNMYYGDSPVLPSAIDTEAFKGIDMFQTGKCAMKLHGVWFLYTYKDTPNLNFASVEVPSGLNGTINTLCWGGYSIYSKSKQKDAAWQFLKYVGGVPGAEVQAKHHFPGIKSVIDKMGWNSDPRYTGFLNGIQYIQPYPDLKNYLFSSSGGTAVQTVLDKVLMKDPLDIKKELDAAVKNAEDLLKKETQKDQ